MRERERERERDGWRARRNGHKHALNARMHTHVHHMSEGVLTFHDFVCMPYMYALYVCLICMPYMPLMPSCMHALYVCLICTPYMHALLNRGDGVPLFLHHVRSLSMLVLCAVILARTGALCPRFQCSVRYFRRDLCRSGHLGLFSEWQVEVRG